MTSLSLVSTQLPKHRYKKAFKTHRLIANKLNRQFAPTTPNQVSCGVVTYIWTSQRWSYLDVVLDLFTRKPIGWPLSSSPDNKLTDKALTMALESRGQPKKPVVSF